MIDKNFMDESENLSDDCFEEKLIHNLTQKEMEFKDSIVESSYVSMWLVRYIPREKGPDKGTNDRVSFKFGKDW